jgi:uncharacterized protein
MKLQPDKSNNLTINAYGDGWVEVNGQRYSQSLIVSSLSGAQPVVWSPARFEDLSDASFEPLASMGLELVIFGSGLRLRFPPSTWLRPLIDKGIGLETMDTAAACRTYNILASEGRRVATAFIMQA